MPEVRGEKMLRRALWDWVTAQSSAAFVVADQAWPGVARLLAACVDDAPARGKPTGAGGAPFVLHEFESVALGALHQGVWSQSLEDLARPLLVGRKSFGDLRDEAMLVALATTRLLTESRASIAARLGYVVAGTDRRSSREESR